MSWIEEKQWQPEPWKWRGFRYLPYRYWRRKSSDYGHTFYTRSYFWERPSIRTTWSEGFREGYRVGIEVEASRQQDISNVYKIEAVWRSPHADE